MPRPAADVLPFTYQRAESVESALRLAATAGASYLAGGTELLNWMKDGISAPTSLIDIARLPLDRIEVGASEIRLGGLARLADVAFHAEVGRVLPGLVSAIEAAASPQIRSMGTLAGNLLQRTRCPYFRSDTEVPCNKRRPGSGCSARAGFDRGAAILGASAECVATHPSDPAVMLVALDAAVELRSGSGVRTVPLADFYCLPGSTPEVETALAPAELVAAVVIPRRGAASAYWKVRDRASYDFALVSAAAVVEWQGDRIGKLALALGGVAARPWRLGVAERELIGQQPKEGAVRAAVSLALGEARPLGGNAFKVELAIRVATRVLLDLAEAR